MTDVDDFADLGFNAGDVVRCVSTRANDGMINKNFRLDYSASGSIGILIDGDDCHVRIPGTNRWRRATEFEIQRDGIYQLRTEWDYEGMHDVTRPMKWV